MRLEKIFVCAIVAAAANGVNLRATAFLSADAALESESKVADHFEEAAKSIAGLDKDSDEKLDFDELLSFCQDTSEENWDCWGMPRDKMIDYFNAHDEDGDGFVTTAELARIFADPTILQSFMLAQINPLEAAQINRLEW